jgi:hypothetical protein
MHASCMSYPRDLMDADAFDGAVFRGDHDGMDSVAEANRRAWEAASHKR